jgi:hypothetical protein
VRRTPVAAEAGRRQREAIVAWWKGEGAARARLTELSLPVLVANGVADVMIPAEHSFAIARTAPKRNLSSIQMAVTRFCSSTPKSSSERYWPSYVLSFLWNRSIDEYAS